MLARLGVRALATHSAPRKAVVFLKNVALFLAAPFVGLAYLLAFPVIGAGMVAWMGIKTLQKHETARQIVHFIAAPLIGLGYVLLAPFIGLAMLARAGINAMTKGPGPE